MSSTVSVTLNELLDAALALPPERRLAWVEALTLHEDLKPRLRALVVRSLLSGALETLPKLPRDESLAHFEVWAHAPGVVVGPYRLQRRLGHGAMGVVWLAERVDGMPPRQVALKFALAASRRSQLQERLAREQQLMAALDHPNIARLYSAGSTPEGQPYLVLEYVRGVVLNQYCRERAPRIRERLRLFAQIAHAVSHAHDCQIVHRDLKPANIMVDTNGTVRLLDFGIGKLLVEDLSLQLQLSALGGQPLTPAYASPEQLLCSRAGLASDVYSLGVILYELLTGALPYAYRRDSNRALRRAILEVPPEPPSRHADLGELGAQAQRELDGIVLRALRKLPEQRYPTARELAAAIDWIS